MQSTEVSIWDFERYTYELSVAAAKLDEMEQYGLHGAEHIRALVDHFPRTQKLTAFAFLQSLQSRSGLRKHEMNLKEIQADERETREHERELRTFWTGIAALLLALAASASLHVKDQSTSLILRVLAGLGVGLVIAYLPGFFSLDAKVNHPTVKVALRSTGALAGFVMIYLFDPGWLGNLLHLR